MKSLQVTLVGGGVYAPLLCEQLAEQLLGSIAEPPREQLSYCPADPRAPHVEPMSVRFHLVARDFSRLQSIAAHADARVKLHQPQWAVQAFSELSQAVEGADIVILLVRVGGLKARAWDEAFPRPFGLVGDEGLGPGGVANAWRTVPMLETLAEQLSRSAPSAWVLNLMAPLGVTTRVLVARGLRVLGLCELPVTTLQKLARALAIPVDGLQWQYAGFNHLGWFWDIKASERACMPDLCDAGLVAHSVLEAFKALPLHYFYGVCAPELAATMNAIRPHGRAGALEHLAQQALEQLTTAPGQSVAALDARPTPWFSDAVVPTLRALLGGPPWHGFANLPNRGALPTLAPDAVVELAATLNVHGAQVIAPTPFPSPKLQRFMKAQEIHQTLTFRAASERDPLLLRRALEALELPVSSTQLTELTRACQNEHFSL